MPQVVLVDTLSEMSREPPRSAEGGLLNRSDIYRKLPPIFVAWFALILEPMLRAQAGGLRSEREGRTISEICDLLLVGDILGALMVCLGRLKAITQASMPDGGGWQVARHHELVAPDRFGIVTMRDRANAARDQREELRTLGYTQGSAMPAKGRGNQRGGNQPRGRDNA